jgi:hypothetical protein
LSSVTAIHLWAKTSFVQRPLNHYPYTSPCRLAKRLKTTLKSRNSFLQRA